MCLRYGEDMIADCNRLALDAIHIVGINDQRPVQSDEMILWQNPLPCGQGQDRAVGLCTAINIYIAIVMP